MQIDVRVLLTLVTVIAAGLGVPLSAQVTEDPAHNELRALRDQVLNAIMSGDVERTLTYVHPDVVVTWQNHEVSRGHQGLREFMRRMGTDAFRGYKVLPSPDELTILHGGDTGISFGASVGQYRLLGREFEAANRWTATLVRENGRWLLAGYHVSSNILNNPLLNAAERGLAVAAGVGGIVGLAVGVLIGRRRRKAAA
jgi:ketosteroid isomerase-like protein